MRTVFGLVISPALSLLRATLWSDRVTLRYTPEPGETAPPAEPWKPRRPDAKIPWAELLQRVFREDMLACPAVAAGG